jgi:HlyD family secretion protein
VDRVIQKKKWGSKRVFTLAGIVAVILLIICAFVFAPGKSSLNVAAERLTISQVSQGNFREFIPVNGIVLPLTTIYLDAAEGGRVEEKFVEDGAVLTKGQPIMRLSNTDLELSLVNQETSVFNLLTQMQISRNAAQQNTITKLNQNTDVDNDFKEAERKYKLNKKLYEEKVIGSQEFRQSEIAYNYAIQKQRLSSEILQQDSTSRKLQDQQAHESYQRTQNALQVMRKKVGDLIVRSPIDGRLTSLDAEIGQNKNKGERLGQVDAANGFKVRADIDEHYISRVYPGLQAEVTIGSTLYHLEIRKVYTQVSNGRFQVDMQFEGKVPDGIRRGQSLQIKLALSDETKAILLPKGSFYETTGGNWVFRVNENSTTAYKTEVQLGRQNPDYYEVLSGLKPGDRIVTSSYDNYKDMQELQIKQP